jgi:hypothetical protein
VPPDADASETISVNYSGYDGQKVSELEEKKPPAGCELLWRANSEELAHKLREIVKRSGQLESLVEVFPSTQGRSPNSAAVQNMGEAPFYMHATPA